MDRDQHELKNYGFCSIYKESFNIILKWKKIFTQVTLALILPLSLLTLVHTLLPQVLVYNTKLGDEYFEKRQLDENEKRRIEIALRLFDVVYFILTINLSIFSTAAVAYTVACVYASKVTTFKKVLWVMLIMWQRLMVTFLWCFAVFLLFHLATEVLLVIWILAFVDTPLAVRITIIVIILVLYIVGFVYITMIWQLASVVSVLEDVYGRKSMGKARKLIKGKMKSSIACCLGIEFMFMIVLVLYVLFVVTALPRLAIRILIGIVCGVLLVMVLLYGSVVPTVFYFVCKAYHQESVDKSSLSEHLEACLGDYVTPRRDVKLQIQNHV